MDINENKPTAKKACWCTMCHAAMLGRGLRMITAVPPHPTPGPVSPTYCLIAGRIFNLEPLLVCRCWRCVWSVYSMCR